jgi:hypothetical protein
MKITFYKRPKPRQFNYKPLYYDQEKEEAEERKKFREGLNSDDPKERLRNEIRRRWKRDKAPAKSTTGFLRIFFFVMFIGYILYVVFFTDFITRLVSVFLK